MDATSTIADPPLATRMARAREETLSLIGLIEDTELNRLLDPAYSPIRWHLGHIAAYEAWWILVKAGKQASPNVEFDTLFDPTRTTKAERAELPAREVLLEFATQVRTASLEVLAGSAPDHDDPLLRDAYIGELVYEHECQHQEIMSFLLQMIPLERLRPPADFRAATPGIELDGSMREVPADSFRMGTCGRGFAYDNEREAHEVSLAAYRIDQAPVTELAFAAFIEEGGYRRESFWTPEGWHWRVEGGFQSPRDWTRSGKNWSIRTLFENRPPLAGYPICGVSCHEAEAYARWAGKRLPTEAEWERAAAWNDGPGVSIRFPWGDSLPTSGDANTDGRAWGTIPIRQTGQSPAGCLDMAGQVWEWTASTFGPYPGFQPFPYAGYSQAWFDGTHRVLRGGSWATRGALCRGSFRNWYEPATRAILAGFRCAADL